MIAYYTLSYIIILYVIILHYIISIVGQPRRLPAPHAGPQHGAVLVKGHMGSARMGSLQSLCLLTEGLLGHQSVDICKQISTSISVAYLFPQSVKINYLCGGPVSVDTVCPQLCIYIYIYMYMDIYI